MRKVRLGEACRAALVQAAPELRQKMGMEPAYLGSAQTAAFIATEWDRAKLLAQRSSLTAHK